MSDQAGYLALVLAGFVTVVAALGAWSRGEPPRALPRDPAVGRAPGEAAGPHPLFAGIPREGRPGRPEVPGLDRLADLLDPWPEFAERVVVHPFAGKAPRVDLEQGDPWHVVVTREGSLEAAPRLLRRERAAPPWLPNAAARDAIHVVVPHAGLLEGPRRKALEALLDLLGEKLPEDGDGILDGPGMRGWELGRTPGWDPELLQGGR